MSIRAAQLIYANVEPEQSPRRIGGFQTLFYTHDLLSADEIEEIEPRLIFIRPAPGSSKTVFFITSTRKAVVARMHAIDETDSAGRGGGYLAHALVISSDDFGSVGCNPFRMLDRYPFSTCLDGVLSAGDMRTGDIVAADIDAQGVDDDVQAASDIDSSVLMALIRCALLADGLRDARTSVVFVDGGGHMLSALRGLFAVLPASVRSECSFDTDFRDCNRALMHCWAIGLPEDAGISERDVVAGRCDSVAGRSSPTMYERWIVGCREDGLLSEAMAHAEDAFALDALSGIDVTQIPGLDAGFLRQYLAHVGLTKGELIHVVAVLAYSGNRGLLEEMIPYITSRPLDVRRLVWNTVKGRQGIPASFTDALGKDVRGLFDRVRGVLRR